MKRKLSPIQIGNIGEKRIAWYLRLRGYKIRERNMRNSYSEIDIIAENREYIVFVEVKTRTEGQLYPARSAVNYKKRKKIVDASLAYMRYNFIKKKPRYDVAEVYLKKGTFRIDKINYLKDAFTRWGRNEVLRPPCRYSLQDSYRKSDD